MNGFKRGVTAFCSSIAILAVAGTAWADARLNATRYSAPTASKVLSVEPLDDSAENLQYRKEFVAQLERAGYQITNDAPAVFYFWTEDYLGGPSGGPSRKLLEVGGTKGTAGDDNARVQLNLYSSQGGGLLNANPGSAGEETQNPTQVRVGARIRTRSSGERLWEAEALGDIVDLDRDTLIKRMIAPISRSVGENVKNQVIKLN